MVPSAPQAKNPSYAPVQYTEPKTFQEIQPVFAEWDIRQLRQASSQSPRSLVRENLYNSVAITQRWLPDDRFGRFKTVPLLCEAVRGRAILMQNEIGLNLFSWLDLRPVDDPALLLRCNAHRRTTGRSADQRGWPAINQSRPVDVLNWTRRTTVTDEGCAIYRIDYLSINDNAFNIINVRHLSPRPSSIQHRQTRLFWNNWQSPETVGVTGCSAARAENRSLRRRKYNKKTTGLLITW